MADRIDILAASAFALLLGGCGARDAVENATNRVEAAANTIDAAAEAVDAAGNAIDNVANAATGAAPAAQGLSAYVGKTPREKIDGVSFLEKIAVRAAVAKVPDAKVRAFVFGYDGPDAPIARSGGRLLAWGCEAHNCGYHNWTVSITPDGKAADICFYHDDDSPDGPALWYLAAGGTETRPGNCPSE